MRCQDLLSWFVLLVCGSALGQSDGVPIEIGVEYRLKSETMSEDRPILVSVPEGYEESDTKHPVIYLLDGASNFHHTTASVNFLAKHGFIPEMIVVGIPNTDDRTRDLTPRPTSQSGRFPTGGGADRLISFMEQELFHWVDSLYRTESYRLLIGHSFGGLFAIHTLINHPGLFNAYLAISPSLWWDNQQLVEHQMDSFLREQKDLKGHLYMTMGNEGGTMLGGAWKFIALLEEEGPKDLHWEFDRMQDQTHGSVVHLSTFRGLEYIFKDWCFDKHRDKILAGGATAVKRFNNKINQWYALPSPVSSTNLISVGKDIMARDGEEEIDLALGLFRMATELDSLDPLAYSTYGACLIQLGNRQAAIDVFKKAYQLDSTNITALIQLKKLGEDVRRLLTEVPFSQEVFEEYGGIYTLYGQEVKLVIDRDKLWMEAGPATQGKRLELFSIGVDQFYYLDDNVRIVFLRADGQITGFDLHVNGETIRALKSDP